MTHPPRSKPALRLTALSLDWWTVVIALVFAALSRLGWLPGIPW